MKSFKRQYKKAILTIFSVIYSYALISAASPEVSFSVSQKEVLLGDSVILTITAKGIENPETPELPSIPNFDVKFRGVRKESFSSFQVVINGKKMESSSSGGGYNFDYELSPKKAGIFDVPSFQINFDGKVYMTEAFQIKVLDSSAKSQDIFFKIEADKKNIYIGEKILISFKWYMNKDISNYRINIPWLDGLKNFLISDPEMDKNQKYQKLIINGGQQVAALKSREVYNGQPYTVLSFKKILMPISAGSYMLDGAFLKCDVIKGYKRSKRSSFFDDFFDSSVEDFFGLGRNAITEPFSTRSDPITINVKEVPNVSRPFGYNGAVGDFNFTVDIKPKNLKVGEPITVTMKVFGSGNIEQLELPEFPAMPAFKSYEPESKVNISQRSGEVVGEKIFEKVLIPRHNGKFEIPKISFIFFNPAKARYQTISRGPFNISVAKGDEISEVKVIAIDNDGSRKEDKRAFKLLTSDIRYIKTDLGHLVSKKKDLYESPFILMSSFGFPVFLLTAVFIVYKRREKYQTDIGFARNRRAFNNIKTNFQEAEKALHEDNIQDFYNALSKGLNKYISDKLNLPEASITSAVVEKLYAKGINDETADIMNRMYKRFEEVLFSSVNPDHDELRKDFEIIKKLIITLERGLR